MSLSVGLSRLFVTSFLGCLRASSWRVFSTINGGRKVLDAPPSLGLIRLYHYFPSFVFFNLKIHFPPFMSFSIFRLFFFLFLFCSVSFRFLPFLLLFWVTISLTTSCCSRKHRWRRGRHRHRRRRCRGLYCDHRPSATGHRLPWPWPCPVARGFYLWWFYIWGRGEGDLEGEKGS